MGISAKLEELIKLINISSQAKFPNLNLIYFKTKQTVKMSSFTNFYFTIYFFQISLFVLLLLHNYTAFYIVL